MRLDHIYFVLENKNITPKYYPGSFTCSPNLMAQAGKARQKWTKQHKNTTLAGPNTQTPLQEKFQIVISEK